MSTSLFLLSLLGALAACEVGLRLFHPKYEDVSRYGKYQADESRLWAPIPNTSRYKTHPDTGARHPVIYNDFGSRQHRRFDVDSLKQAGNVAFFGDSFAENSGIEAQYSFTEILDFLLNLGPRDFNVLNFGVDGYGLGQEFVWYQQFPHRDDLDHVLYVFCDNDIENFHNHRLFSLDDSGELVANVAVARGTLVTTLSRLHLTHLVLDFAQRLPWLRSPVALLPHKEPPLERIEPIHLVSQRIMRRKRGSAPPGDALDASIATFQAVLSNWKEAVEARGGNFRVVVLPYLTRGAVQGVFPAHLDVVYLFECFNDMIPLFNYADWSFRSTDTHWNEAGNMVAAHCLYRLLEEETGAAPLSETDLANARHEYYSAVGTGNWNPPAAWVAPAERALDGAQIAAKYLELDHRNRVLEQLDSSTPIADDDWAIYMLPEQPSGRTVLAYVKTPCRKEDQENPFFLHVTPRDPRHLSEERAIHGFENLDFYFTDAWLATSSLFAPANEVSREGWTLNNHCVFGTELPRYEIARIRTGQYTPDGTIWEVEIAPDGVG